MGVLVGLSQQAQNPTDINNKNSSSSLSFVVPSHPNLRIRGLNVYSMYTLADADEIGLPFQLLTKINNKTKDLKWIYTPVAIACPGNENEGEKEFVWLSYWRFENHLESGDEVDISVIAGFEVLQVKEFGIKLVWGKDEIKVTHEHHHNNTRGVIGGDLSNYQFLSTRAFFLCHHYMHPYFTKTSTRKSLLQEVFGDHVTYEDFERWMCYRNRSKIF